mmetsp:Transcript_48948/g.56270  ORF Transcript_48948/g.56270 Transcript_48948/m.56270 type:complete len:269 (-) Transcript_48948:182-988(-)
MKRSNTKLRKILLKFANPIQYDKNPAECPTITEERNEEPHEHDHSRTPSVFDTWLKGGFSSLMAKTLHNTAMIPSTESPKRVRSRRPEMSLLETNHKGHSRSLLLKLDDKVTSQDLFSVGPASLDGVYQEIILMGEADYALLFKNLGRALQPSAEFSVLVVIPHKKRDVISRDILKKGFGSNKIHERLKKHASKHYVDIHNIEEKRALLSKTVWMEIYKQMLTQKALWKSVLQSQRFPKTEESIPTYLASRLDCTIAVVRGQQSSLFR